MSEMNTQQMMEYLRMASELEVSVYKQEQTRQQAHANLVLRDVPRPDLEEPQKEEPVLHEETFIRDPQGARERVIEELENNEDYDSERKKILNLLVATKAPDNSTGGVIMILGLLVFLLSPFIVPEPEYWLIPFCMGMALFVPGVTMIVQNALREKAIQRVAEEVREKEEKYIEEKYQREMAAYRAEKQKQEEQYNAETAVAKQNFEKAKTEIAKLDAPLEETKGLLAKLYAADVIFPKYRNMVAMCTMYEYFASGRCTELTGPNGAYNLYEQELRQNLIINQLENINANLEQVKQNQYILYQGIMETNQTLQTISSDVKQLVNATEDIAVSSRITAFCSQVTAANTTAIKYVTTLEALN